MESRNARLYLIGLAVSLVGNSALSLVAGIWVKSLTGSSAGAGLVSACVYAPSLAGPLCGLVADRFERQRLLVWANLLAGLIVLSLLAVHSRHQVWLIYLVMLVYGAELVLADPVEAALFAEMLTLELRQRLNGWRLGMQELARVLAPLAGAGLFVLLGGGAVAVLDALTFFVAAAVTSLLRFRKPRREPRQRQLWPELTAGARHIRSVPELRVVMLAAAGVMALSGVVGSAQYSLVIAIGQRPAFLGVLSAALGLGSVLAALSANRLRGRIGERGLACAGLVNYALGSLLNAVGSTPAAVAGALVLGFALPWVFLAALSVSQRLTPVALQGRVSAAVTLALFGPLAPLQALGAFAITQTGYREMYLGAAAAAALLSLWLGGTGHRVRRVSILSRPVRLPGTHHPQPEGAAMRFMMFMIPNILDENWGPKPDAVEAMGRYNQELERAGVLLTLEGLHAPSAGARVSFAEGATPTVTDGPFGEAKEVVGGYWMINVRDRGEAVEWARRCPAGPGDVIEIRQVYEHQDFLAELKAAAAGAAQEQ